MQMSDTFFFSFTPTTIKLNTMKDYMKSKIFCMRMNLNMQMHPTLYNKPRYTFTPITIKPLTVKLYMKSNILFYKLVGKIYFKYANELNTSPN